MLATDFGPTRPSSGQHLQKLKNAVAYNMMSYIICTSIFKFL